jgi:hypothetical protein
MTNRLMITFVTCVSLMVGNKGLSQYKLRLISIYLTSVKYITGAILLKVALSKEH